MVSNKSEHNLNRPVLIVANSSWYLNHYRSLLIKELKNNFKYVIALSPIDSSTYKLSRNILHIPFRIDRSGGLSPFSLLISLSRMLFIVRALKPSLIHSHTLKANFITSVIASLYGIPIIYSFAGMGRMFTKSSFKKFIFIRILKIIFFFSSMKRVSKFKIKKNQTRCKYIFQNPRDLQFVKSVIKPSNEVLENFSLIPGSGLPEIYQNKFNQVQNNWIKNLPNKSTHFQIEKIKFIYCGRLIKSKGIYEFVKIANVLNKNQYYIYGDFDEIYKKNNLKNELIKKNNVKLQGNVINPLLNHLNDFPILLLLSQYGEGLPRTMLEAMSLGIPVISTKIAACELFDSRHLYLLDTNDLKGLENALENIIIDFKSGKLKLKLLNARDLVTNKYSEMQIVQDTLEIYKKQLENKSIGFLNSKDINDFNLWISK